MSRLRLRAYMLKIFTSHYDQGLWQHLRRSQPGPPIHNGRFSPPRLLRPTVQNTAGNRDRGGLGPLTGRTASGQCEPEGRLKTEGGRFRTSDIKWGKSTETKITYKMTDDWTAAAQHPSYGILAAWDQDSQDHKLTNQKAKVKCQSTRTVTPSHPNHQAVPVGN